MDATSSLCPLISRRRSPRAFDPSRLIEPDKLTVVFEAARWAPSSGNGQPWSFIVGYNFDKCHQDVLSTLKDSNKVWAKNAPVLLLTIAKIVKNEQPDRFAFHDVGLATGSLFLQACELGLFCHFMAGFFPERAREIFSIPSGYEPVAAGAIGYMGDPNSLPDKLRERELEPRHRRSLEEFVFAGEWNNPLVMTPALRTELGGV